jgi:transposase
MRILKQVLGVDVAQKELVVCLGSISENLKVELYARRVFVNNQTGFVALIKWVKKQVDESIKLQFVMEATGVYHQKFAYFLDENNYNINIVLPNKISNYIRTLENKTITDKTCADAIAQFGLERNLENWKRPNSIYKNLKQLTRERDQVLSERVMVKNQLHAEKAEAEPHDGSLDRINARISFLSKQLKEINQDIETCISKDKTLKNNIKIITTIPGIGSLTAAIVLGETNGFELIRNKKQLVSYSGLDVIEKQSGTSIKGKTKISKRGNRNLRKSMHLPSLTALRYIPSFQDLYSRIFNKTGLKMKGIVAVHRKLLELIYTLFKTKTTFNKNYETEKRAMLHEVAVAL